MRPPTRESGFSEDRRADRPDRGLRVQGLASVSYQRALSGPGV